MFFIQKKIDNDYKLSEFLLKKKSFNLLQNYIFQNFLSNYHNFMKIKVTEIIFLVTTNTKCTLLRKNS